MSVPARETLETFAKTMSIAGGAGGVKRWLEEKLEPVFQRGMSEQVNTNTLVGTALRHLASDEGARATAHGFFSALGAAITLYGNQLFPNLRGPQAKVVRQVLMGIAPALMLVSESAMDAIEKIGKDVDSLVAPPGSASLGKLDGECFIFIHEGRRYLVLPSREEDGTVIRGEDGDPIPTNAEVVDVYFHEVYTQTQSRTVPARGKGGRSRTVTDPPKKRTLIPYPVPIAIDMVMQDPEVSSAQLDRIERLMRPTGAYEDQIDDQSHAVIAALHRYIAVNPDGLTNLELAHKRELLESMGDAQPHPTKVRQYLGVPLYSQIVHDPTSPYHQTFKTADAKTAFAAIDASLSGEPGVATQVQKGLSSLPDVLTRLWEGLSGVSPYIETAGIVWLYVMVAAVTCLILSMTLPAQGYPWFPSILLIASGGFSYYKKVYKLAWLLGATLVGIWAALIAGVPSWEVGLWMGVAGSVIGFAFTWPGPLCQQGINLLGQVLPGLSKDGLMDLFRRIALFAMSTGAIFAGLLWFQAPPLVRVFFLGVTFLSMSTLFGYRSLNEIETANKIAKRSLSLLNYLGVGFALCLFTEMGRSAYTQTPFRDGGAFLRWIIDGGAVPAYTYAVGPTVEPWMLGVAVMLLAATVVGVVWGMNRPEIIVTGSASGGGSSNARRNGMLLGTAGYVVLLAMLVVFGLWMVSGGSDSDSVSASAPAAVSAPVSVPARASVSTPMSVPTPAAASCPEVTLGGKRYCADVICADPRSPVSLKQKVAAQGYPCP